MFCAANGKVERFNPILKVEWGYAKACYQDFVEYYNRRRPHTALNGASPASRLTNQAG